ncbi:hypothetical protein LG58_3110 [Kosakonia radicincitans YD4]|nr:hypothetical protein LG58_3110 [Kosakonia radicincitans YD4]
MPPVAGKENCPTALQCPVNRRIALSFPPGFTLKVTPFRNMDLSDLHHSSVRVKTVR